MGDFFKTRNSNKRPQLKTFTDINEIWDNQDTFRSYLETSKIQSLDSNRRSISNQYSGFPGVHHKNLSQISDNKA